MRASRFTSWSAFSISTLFLAACTADRPSSSPGSKDDSRTEHAKAPSQVTSAHVKSTHATSTHATPAHIASAQAATVAVGFTQETHLGSATLVSGTQAQLRAYSLSSGTELTQQTQWSTSSPAIVNVSNELGQRGALIAGEPGLAIVHAQVFGETVDVKVLVTATHIRVLTVSSPRGSVAPGRNIPLTAIASLQDGSQVDATGAVQWTSQTPDTLEIVDAAGTVTAGGRWWGIGTVGATLEQPYGTSGGSLSIDVLAGAGDEDHDGYFVEDDCDDADASRSPGAPEIPDNGKDDNCNGSVDEACTNGVTCSRVLAPYDVVVDYGWRVSGSAEAKTVVTVRDITVNPPRLTNINVDAAGHFTKYGFASQLAILQTAKAGSAPSAKIWEWLGTGAEIATTPPAKDFAFEAVDAQTMNISGSTLLHALAGVRNISQQIWQPAQSIASGFAPRFRATLLASPGDWIDVRTSYSSTATPGLIMQVPGADTRPPVAPTVRADPSDPDAPAVLGRSEGRSTVTLRNTRSKVSVQVTADDDGNYYYGGGQEIHPGDFVVAWANDGTFDGPKTGARIAGHDTTSPPAVESLATTPSSNGRAALTGRVEIGARVRIDINGSGEMIVNSIWSGTDDFATFEALVPASGGDTVHVAVLDAVDHASPSQAIWIPAAGDTPPAPRASVAYVSSQWQVRGTAQPNATVHVYNASSRALLGIGAVSDPLGNFTMLFGTENAQSGDIFLLWASANGNESERGLATAAYGATADRSPLPVLDALASESLDGVTIVSGRSEIRGTLTFAVGSDPISSTADVIWSSASTDTLGTFYAAVVAPPGASIRITPYDWRGFDGPPEVVTVPNGASRLRMPPRE